MNRKIVEAIKEALKAPRQSLSSWIVNADEFKEAVKEIRQEKISSTVGDEDIGVK